MVKIGTTRFFEQYGGFLIGVFAALVIVFLTIFLIKPKIIEVWIGRDELVKGQEKLLKMTQKANELGSLSEAELRSKVVKVITALPNEKDVPALMATLERLLGETGLQIDSLQLTPGFLATDSAKVAAQAEKLDFQLSAKGSFEQVKSFLEKLSQTARILTVKQVSMSQGKEGEEQNLKVTLQMAAYWQPLPTTLGDVAEPLPTLTADEEKLYQKVSRFTPLGATSSAVPSGKLDPFTR